MLSHFDTQRKELTKVTLTFQGGLSGMIIGLVLTLWVGIGAQLYPPTSAKTNPLPVSTAGCNKTLEQNTTATPWTSTVTLTQQPELVIS